MKAVRAPEAWKRSTGKKVKVGVLDTGIDKNHPDLPVAGGVSVVPGHKSWDDGHGHGTQCAGVIGARNNDKGVVGVAPDCEIYAIKFHLGNRASLDQILAGMTWAARNRMDILSFSQWDTNGATTAKEAPWVEVQRAARLLTNNNCLVVGISGNSGFGYPTHFVTNPGRCPDIMAIAATDNEKKWWSGSSYGPVSLPSRQGVELAAPGIEVYSTYIGGGYACDSGTSMACPHVAGAAALIRQLKPMWNPDQIRTHLQSHAVDIDASGFDIKTGAGFLDCFAAVKNV
ncbi:MAG: S8 family serine peptidase [Planctomycetota bacterium]